MGIRKRAYKAIDLLWTAEVMALLHGHAAMHRPWQDSAKQVEEQFITWELPDGFKPRP